MSARHAFRVVGGTLRIPAGRGDLSDDEIVDALARLAFALRDAGARGRLAVEIFDGPPAALNHRPGRRLTVELPDDYLITEEIADA